MKTWDEEEKHRVNRLCLMLCVGAVVWGLGNRGVRSLGQWKRYWMSGAFCSMMEVVLWL